MDIQFPWRDGYSFREDVAMPLAYIKVPLLYLYRRYSQCPADILKTLFHEGDTALLLFLNIVTIYTNVSERYNCSMQCFFFDQISIYVEYG
jgi:hypothetical protein